jgi:hypothetical protein
MGVRNLARWTTDWADRRICTDLICENPFNPPNPLSIDYQHKFRTSVPDGKPNCSAVSVMVYGYAVVSLSRRLTGQDNCSIQTAPDVSRRQRGCHRASRFSAGCGQEKTGDLKRSQMRSQTSYRRKATMTQKTNHKPLSLAQLITVPALITLAVTVLRLVGERQGWSRVLFNPEPGGPLGLIGIVWLVPILGIYFALRLANAGDVPERAGRAVLYAFLGILISAIGFAVAVAVSQPGRPLAILISGVAAIVAVIVQRKAWPALFKTLIAYGYAARIPVTIIMFFAIKGNWRTHYDAPPPNFPADIGWFEKFILIGVIPQLVFWISFTVIFGMLFGAAAFAIAKRGKQSSVSAEA